MLNNPQDYSYEKIQNMITNLPKTEQQIAALAYGTGSRVSELNQIKKININQDNKYMRITCSVLKKRKTNISRLALIRLDEEWLIKPIQELLIGKQDEEILLPFHRVTIYRKLVASMSINPHGFRKLRATHLVIKFGFNGQQLKTFFDWSRSDMADNYVKLNTKNIEY